MIWQKIPTTNNAPADVEIGQKDFVTALAGDIAGLATISTGNGTCASNGSDSSGNPTYPVRMREVSELSSALLCRMAHGSSSPTAGMTAF